MSMLRIFDVAGSAVSAQSQRLNVVASNLANADTVAGPDGKSYKARQAVFETVPMGPRGQPASAALLDCRHCSRRHQPTRAPFNTITRTGRGCFVLRLWCALPSSGLPPLVVCSM